MFLLLRNPPALLSLFTMALDVCSLRYQGVALSSSIRRVNSLAIICGPTDANQLNVYSPLAVNTSSMTLHSTHIPQLSSDDNNNFLFPVASPQVSPHHLPGHPEPPECRDGALALLLDDGLRVCRREHAASAGHVPGERPTTGAAALHHHPDTQAAGGAR